MRNTFAIALVCTFIALDAGAADASKDVSMSMTFHDSLMVCFQSFKSEVQSLGEPLLDRFVKLDLNNLVEQTKMIGLSQDLSTMAHHRGIKPKDFDIRNEDHARLLIEASQYNEMKVNDLASGVISGLYSGVPPHRAVSRVMYLLSVDPVALSAYHKATLEEFLPQLMEFRKEALAKEKVLDQ